MQIRTEAGPRLHIEPPLDYSEDFEPCGDVTVKAKDASEGRSQVGLVGSELQQLSGHFLLFIPPRNFLEIFLEERVLSYGMIQ